jgi:hypothetical protein
MLKASYFIAGQDDALSRAEGVRRVLDQALPAAWRALTNRALERRPPDAHVVHYVGGANLESSTSASCAIITATRARVLRELGEACAWHDGGARRRDRRGI